jgi:hypothetical protein
VLTGYVPNDPDGFRNSITFYSLIRAIPWARKWHSRGEPHVLDWVRHVLQNASTT